MVEPSAADRRGERLATCADRRVQRAGRNAEAAAETPDVQRRIGQPLLDLALYLGPQHRPPVDGAVSRSAIAADSAATSACSTSDVTAVRADPSSCHIDDITAATTAPAPSFRQQPAVWRRRTSRQLPKISWGRR